MKDKSIISQYQSILDTVEKTGVYHMPRVNADLISEAAKELDFAVFSVDLTSAKNKETVLRIFAKSLLFPNWFGHNLDALVDCLSDLSWQPAPGYVLLLQHCDGVHGEAEQDFVALLQVIQSVAVEWRDQNVPFWCFVDMQSDGINWLPDIR